MKRVFLVAAGVLVLNGCGGGGNSATESAEISGKIIDGYISGAQIFWDCNTNGIADANEISTTSSNGGNYSISPAPNTNCRLTASIPASAIDSDTNSSVLHPYLMYALGNNPTIITPLTTLVALNSNSNNQLIVASEIKQKFNLALSIDVDYLSGSTDAHVNDRKFAKVTAQLLQSNFSSISGYESDIHQKIVDNVTSLKDVIQKASISDVIQNTINIPSAALKRFFRSFYTDPTLGVKVNDVGLTTAQSSYLNSLIVDARVTPFIAGGVIDWKRMDLATLKNIGVSLTANGFPPNPDDLKAEHYAKQLALDEKYRPLLADANQLITLDPESIGALFDIADSMIKGGYGVAKMAAVAPNVSGVFNYVNMTPGTQGKLIKNLDKLSKYSGFATKASACGFSISEFRTTFSDTSVGSDDYLKALKGTSSLVGCLGSIVDDAPLGKGIKYVVDLFTAGSTSERDRVDAALTLLDTLNMIINMTPPTPFSNFTSGFLDVMGAGFNSYSAGLTISDQAGKKWLVAKSAIEDLQKAEDDLLNREYFARYIKSRLGANIIRADWKVPTSSIITSPLYDRYTGATGEACYSRQIGTQKSAGVYTLSNSQYCRRGGQWVNVTGADNERYLDTQGNLYPFSSIEIKDTGNNTYTAGYGGSIIWNISYTQKSAGTYSQTVRAVSDHYSVDFDPNSYIYNNVEEFAILLYRYNTSSTNTGYLTSGGTVGFLFEGPSTTSGSVKYFSISDPNRSAINTGAWTRKAMGANTEIIELDEKSTLLNSYPDPSLRKIYYRGSSAGVREGNKTLTGRVDSGDLLDRNTINAIFAREGLPATPN